MAFLVDPSIEYKESYLEYMEEESANNGIHAMFGDEKICEDFNWFVERLLDCRDKQKIAGINPDWVPFSTFWLVENDKYLARISFRHELNDHLLNVGGHIGYDVRPSERRKGYGHLCMKLGAKKAKSLGFDKVLITCDKNNAASLKIIEASGAVFENEYADGLEVPKLRYWLSV